MARLIRADDVAPQPWRNGGGLTRELLAWPSTEQSDLRIAVANIDVDGPFSSYEGVERWITVISGIGVALAFGDGVRELVRGDEPLCFDGAAAPGCRLLDGPTRDLNLMVSGGRGVMRSVQAGTAWTEEFAMRGVFTAVPGQLFDDVETREVTAMTLLWSNTRDHGDWTFDFGEPQAMTQAWWLGFTPSA